MQMRILASAGVDTAGSGLAFTGTFFKTPRLPKTLAPLPSRTASATIRRRDVHEASEGVTVVLRELLHVAEAMYRREKVRFVQANGAARRFKI